MTIHEVSMSSGTRSAAPAEPRAKTIWIVALACLGALYLARLGGGQWEPAFGDAPSIYLVSAESLAHNTGYRSINYPQSPPSQLYPVGYPLILSLILRVVPFGPKSVFISRLVTVACTLAWVEMSRRLLQRFFSPTVSAMAALAIGLTPAAFELGGVIKADLVFGAFFVAAILLAVSDQRSSGGRQTVWPALLLGFVAAAAMLIRTIGFTLVFGVALDLAIRRRWRRLIWFGIAAGITVVPWSLWCAHNYGGTFHSYVSENVITWRTPLEHFWALATTTAPGMAIAPLESQPWEVVSSRLHLGWIPVVLGLAITVVAIVGWLKLLRQLHVVALVLGPYMLIVFFWWFVATRFVVPVLPLIVLCGGVGVKAIVGKFSVRRARIGLAAALVCVVGGLIVDAGRLKNVWVHGHFGGPLPARQWKDKSAGLAWIRGNTPADAVIYSSYPAGVYLFTSRLTLDLNDGSHIGDVYTPSDSIDLAAELKRTQSINSRYVFTCERDENTPARHYIDTGPSELQLVWSSTDGVAKIYQVVK